MATPSPSIRLVPAPELPAADWHAAFSAAFADYLIGPFTLTLAQWPAFLARQGVDFGLSRGALIDGELRAFALVAARPARRRWRLGTMGAVPAARGSGAAQVLLADFIERGRAAGVDTLELEVFAANERARRLYERHGFEAVHLLHGYERAPGGGEAAPDAIEPLSLAQAWQWLDEADATLPDLPLQVTRPVLQVAAAAAPVDAPLHACRHGDALLVFAEQPATHTLVVHSLIDRDPAQPGAYALATALATHFPGHMLRVPALQRPDLGGEALLRAGFVRQPLHQCLMRRSA